VYLLTVTGQEKEMTAVYGILPVPQDMCLRRRESWQRSGISSMCQAMKKVVAYLEPGIFHRLGGKQVHLQDPQMIEDGGELLVHCSRA
jgi:hypothetical protein